MITFLINGCGRQAVQFDPKFYVGDSRAEVLINREGHVIACHEPDFEEMACMTFEKLHELREILRVATIPRRLKMLRWKRKEMMRVLSKTIESKRNIGSTSSEIKE